MQNLILFILASCLSIIPVENRHIPIENRHACSLQKKISYTLNSAQKVNVEFAQPKNHTSKIQNPKSKVQSPKSKTQSPASQHSRFNQTNKTNQTNQTNKTNQTNQTNKTAFNPLFSVSITDWETDEIFVDKLDINFTYKPKKSQNIPHTQRTTTTNNQPSTPHLSNYKTTFTVVITDESLEEKLSEIPDFQLSQVLITPNKIKLYGNINIGFGALLPAVISGKLFVDNNTEIHFEPSVIKIFDFSLPTKLSFIIQNAVNPLLDVENIDIDYADVENFEEKFGDAPQVKIKKVSLLKDCIKIFGETM